MNYLNNIGVPAIAIGYIYDPELIQQVMNGNYCACFQHQHGEEYLKTENLEKKLIAVVTDEAHCITQWYISPFIKLKTISCFMIFLSRVYN